MRLTTDGASSGLPGGAINSVAPNSVVLYEAPEARVLSKSDRKKKAAADFQI